MTTAVKSGSLNLDLSTDSLNITLRAGEKRTWSQQFEAEDDSGASTPLDISSWVITGSIDTSKVAGMDDQLEIIKATSVEGGVQDSILIGIDTTNFAPSLLPKLNSDATLPFTIKASFENGAIGTQIVTLQVGQIILFSKIGD